MSRALTTLFRDETLASQLSPALFALLDFQSGAVRVWSGLGTKTWDGNDYIGLGNFGSVSSVEETTDVRANSIAFQLTGVPSSLIATILSDNYQGRTAKLWIGSLDASGNVIADPYLIFAGRMDNVEIDEGPNTSVVRVFAESRLIDLQRSKERRFTHEDQQINYSGDLGLKFMPTANSKPFVWGGETIPAAGGGEGSGTGGDNLE